MSATLTMGCDSYGRAPGWANHTRVSTLNRTSVRGKDPRAGCPGRAARAAGLAPVRDVLIVAAALVTLWLVFVAVVFIAKPDDVSAKAAVKLLPDTVRLVRRLVGDKTIPRRTRWLIWALIAYLALPIDLVPDFIPVAGYADDVIVTAFVLRYVIRKAGPQKLTEHWPGTPEGLDTLTRALRLCTASG